MRDDETVLIGASRAGETVAGVSALALASLTVWLMRRGWTLDLFGLSRLAARNATVTEAGFARAFTALIAGLLAAAGIWRLARTWLSERAPLIMITADGIADPRLTPGLIPWSAIQDVSEWHWDGRRGIVLLIEPAILETLPLSEDLREGRRLGIKGLPVLTRDLSTRYGALLALLRSKHAAARTTSTLRNATP